MFYWLTELPAQLPHDLDTRFNTFPIKSSGSPKPVVKKTEQDKRMKATYPHKMKVISIAIAACLGQGDLRARRQEHESASACAVQGAMGERENGVEEDYMGESGKEKITLPNHEITNIVSTACQRQWDEEDAACLSIAVGEQNQGFTACLIQKAVEGCSLVEDYMGEEGGKERHGSRKTYDIESSKGEGDVANPPQEVQRV